MTPVRHVIHPGVSVGPGRAFDSARRVTLDTGDADSDADLVAAALIAGGCARLDQSTAERTQLLLAVLRERSLAPVRALRLGFARRHAQGGALTIPWHVLMAVRLPVLVMTLGIGGVALVAGILTGELASPLIAAAWAVLACAVSIVCHEAAHLLALRALAGDRTVGAIEHSWVNVWIVGPTLGDWVQRVAALAGPLAGMMACVALAYTGVEEWICWAVGIVHAANLFPLAPDGRIVFRRSAADPGLRSGGVSEPAAYRT